MSLEAVQKVTESEQNAQRDKAEAAEQATYLVSEAERTGQARLDRARAEAETQVKALISKAEDRARQHTEGLTEETRQACDTLRREAESHLDDAVKLIIGKVVAG